MRHIYVFLLFIKVGLMSMMEYRVSYFSWSLMSVGWSAFFIFSAFLITSQVNSIAGWPGHEVLILTSVETIFVGLLWFFVFPNLIDFSELIRRGNLDCLLTKPLNIRFLVSVKRFQLENILRIILVSFYISWLIQKNNIQIDFANVLEFLFLMGIGLIIFYNIFFSITVLNFWFVNIFNLDDFFHNILDMGRYPVQIYKGLIEIVTFIIPIGYIATFSVQALLGKLETGYYFLGVFLAILTTLFSQWFWNFALRHYSSASS